MVKTILKYSCLAGAASLLASPAFAQEAPEHSVFILNSLLNKNAVFRCFLRKSRNTAFLF